MYDKNNDEPIVTQPDCRCCQPTITYNSLSKYGRVGLGRQQSETETVDILSLEIEKIRGILAMSEGSIPTAKKDMLNFALRDKEAQLREVRARQDALRMEEELKKAEEEARKKAQAATEEEKKEGSEAAETTEPPKLSQLIKELAQQIVTDFLKNEAFQKQVCDTHGE